MSFLLAAPKRILALFQPLGIMSLKAHRISLAIAKYMSTILKISVGRSINRLETLFLIKKIVAYSMKGLYDGIHYVMSRFYAFMFVHVGRI